MGKYEQLENVPTPHQEIIPPDFDDSDMEFISAGGERIEPETDKQIEPGRPVQERIINSAIDRLVQEKFPGAKGEDAKKLREELLESANSILHDEQGIKVQWFSALSGEVSGRHDEATEQIEDQLALGFMRRLKEKIDN